MKLIMDEKLKHRLIGIAVIISLGAIFAPALMKKSNQSLGGSFSVNVKLPPKPLVPGVVMKDKQELFKTIKVAKVDISSESKVKPLDNLVKAEAIKPVRESQLAEDKGNKKAAPIQFALNKIASSTQDTVKVSIKPSLPHATVVKKQIILAKAHQFARKPVMSHKKIQIKKEHYAVQLASFIQQSNAQSLINQLKRKGYKAHFAKSSKLKGVYKVYVGHSANKAEVIKLKNQLASTMKLQGIIVNTGLS